MNTNTRFTTRSTALAACLIALFAGATACGTDDGTAAAPAAIAKQGTSDSFIKSSGAGQEEYLQQLRAKRADALRSHKYADDRRQPPRQAPDNRTATSQHPAGYDKALAQR